MTVQQRLRDFICTNFYVPDLASLRDEDSLIDLGFIDSTGVMEVIDFLDRTFGVQVGDAEIVPENLGSIARIHGFIESKKRSAA